MRRPVPFAGALSSRIYRKKKVKETRVIGNYIIEIPAHVVWISSCENCFMTRNVAVMMRSQEMISGKLQKRV